MIYTRSACHTKCDIVWQSCYAWYWPGTATLCNLNDIMKSGAPFDFTYKSHIFTHPPPLLKNLYLEKSSESCLSHLTCHTTDTLDCDTVFNMSTNKSTNNAPVTQLRRSARVMSHSRPGLGIVTSTGLIKAGSKVSVVTSNVTCKCDNHDWLSESSWWSGKRNELKAYPIQSECDCHIWVWHFWLVRGGSFSHLILSMTSLSFSTQRLWVYLSHLRCHSWCDRNMLDFYQLQLLKAILLWL